MHNHGIAPKNGMVAFPAKAAMPYPEEYKAIGATEAISGLISSLSVKKFPISKCFLFCL